MTGNSSKFDRAITMWREVDFPSLESPTVELRFVEELKALYGNGTVLHKTFALPDCPELTTVIKSGQLHATYFFERFWRAKSVSQALPYALADVNFLSTDTFRQIHPVELPGSLAATLMQGGAYTTVLMQARDALQIAAQAAELLLNGDFQSSFVFLSYMPWSTFFFDVAWDYTWLIIRPSENIIEVVMATDTD